MPKNNQTTSKKARIKPKNQQTKEESLQARKGTEVSAGFAQIALVLFAVILSSFLGFQLSEKKWKAKAEFNLLKCAELSQFDAIEDILTKKNEEYVAPDFK